jgi:hypothetical protein
MVVTSKVSLSCRSHRKGKKSITGYAEGSEDKEKAGPLMKLSWKMHLERVAAQAFRTSILLVYGSKQIRMKQSSLQNMEPGVEANGWCFHCYSGCRMVGQDYGG